MLTATGTLLLLLVGTWGFNWLARNVPAKPLRVSESSLEAFRHLGRIVSGRIGPEPVHLRPDPTPGLNNWFTRFIRDEISRNGGEPLILEPEPTPAPSPLSFPLNKEQDLVMNLGDGRRWKSKGFVTSVDINVPKRKKIDVSTFDREEFTSGRLTDPGTMTVTYALSGQPTITDADQT